MTETIIVHNSDADRLGRRQISRKNVLFKKKENLNIIIQYYFIQLNFAPLSYCSTFDTSWKLKNKAINFFQINLELIDILMGFVVVWHGGNIILRQCPLF